MHEFALAEAVLTTALDAAAKERLTRISRIAVEVGELQRIRRETFEFALRELVPRGEPRLADARITVEITPVRFRCRPCGHAFGLADTGGPRDGDEAEAIHFIPELAHAFLSCPECASPDFELLEGRGVTIAAIEGERDDD